MNSVTFTCNSKHSYWAAIALAIAVLGTIGSLYLSIGLGLKACPLCFYQRTFMMAIVAVLGVGLWVDRSQANLLCLLCIPLAIAGLGVAAFHQSLVLADKLECPNGLFGLGTAPLQSSVIFAILVSMVFGGAIPRIVALVGGVCLGLALAWGCIASAPPMPPAPAAPYDQPLEICRPPFREGNLQKE